MEVKFPLLFLERMKELLQDEYPAFLSSLAKPYYRSGRYNLLKCNTFPDDVKPWLFAKSPFCKNATYFKAGIKPITLASYRNGGFYMQEASASAVVGILNPQVGEYILDLCAAPGSKMTQIAECLNQKGVLVANEYNHARANTLLENSIRHGIQNAIILNEDTSKIATEMRECFDKVLVDAPCSGEGLFWKQVDAIKEWSLDNIKLCVKRQEIILENAYHCLRKGGDMVYSTCTFNKEENEEQILSLLAKHEDLELLPIEVNYGRSGFDPKHLTRRIFPMDGGSGHFIALLHKKGNSVRRNWSTITMNSVWQREVNNMLVDKYKYFYTWQNKLYAGNYPFLVTNKLKVLRQMVYVGEIKHQKLFYDHAFFMSSNFKQDLIIKINHDEFNHYIHGETLCKVYPKGYYAISYDNLIVGGVRSDGKQLKNIYPKVLRTR